MKLLGFQLPWGRKVRMKETDVTSLCHILAFAWLYVKHGWNSFKNCLNYNANFMSVFSVKAWFAVFACHSRVEKKIILLLPINLQKVNVVVSLWIPHSQRFTSTCSKYSIVGSYSVFMLPGQYQVMFYLKFGHILFEKKYLYMAVVPAFRLPYFEYFPVLYWMFQFTWSAFKNS